MAIGPNDFIVNFKQALEEFEAFIDEKLTQVKPHKYATYVDIDAPQGYSEAHHKALKTKYRDVGWELVVYHHTYIRFYAKQ